MSAQVRDMTKGSPAKLILLFAVPLMLGNIFQQLYTMVDTIVVGQVAGVQALAALGAVEWIMWMTLGVSTGVTQGFSILISQHYGAKKWKLLLGVWITVGIHSMVLMLLPLFLYKRVTLRFLIFTLFGVILLSPVINLMNILSLFPINDGFMLLLQEKVAVYATDQEGVTKRYIVISIITLLYALFLNKQKQFSKEDKYVNIIFIYLLIMWLCFNNATAFVRMVNFAHFIYTFELIFLLKYMRKKSPQFVLFIFFFLITNFQMTLGRTITGAYRSSYMDNSIVKILTSSVFDYLSYKTFF